MVDKEIAALVEYARRKGLIEDGDVTWAINSLLDALKLDSYTPEPLPEGEIHLAQVLDRLLDDAAQRGVLEQNSVVYRDLLDRKIFRRLVLIRRTGHGREYQVVELC